MRNISRTSKHNKQTKQSSACMILANRNSRAKYLDMEREEKASSTSLSQEKRHPQPPPTARTGPSASKWLPCHRSTFHGSAPPGCQKGDQAKADHPGTIRGHQVGTARPTPPTSRHMSSHRRGLHPHPRGAMGNRAKTSSTRALGCQAQPSPCPYVVCGHPADPLAFPQPIPRMHQRGAARL